MTLKECYQILHVDQSASLEEVKRAYRRRAFELHPDLNPDVSDASRQFQRLNEAYVILNRLVAAREAAAAEAAARQAAGQQEPPRAAGSRWYDWGFSFGGGKKAEPEQEPPRENSEERRAQREEAYREEIRREEERQRQRRQEEDRRREEIRKAAERRAEQARAARERAERDRAEKAGQAEREAGAQTERPQPERPRAERPQSERPRAERPQTEGTRAERPQAERPQAEKSQAEQPRPERPHAARPGAAHSAGSDNMYAEQQEVLRDILNDDFARRVFEDIYSEIRKKTPPPTREEVRSQRDTSAKPASSVRAESVQAESVPPKARGGLPFGLDQFKLDFSSGVGNTVKGWLRGQIDEEQTIRLPATGLYPGARVRLQIRRGLADELITLEVTLPPDFVVGKPIRLRGMGKKLGSMQGDLYLTVLAK